MELWDIYDEDGNITGRTVERGKPLQKGEYHLVVHIWIINSNGEFLISKRTPNKPFPNMWETTGGSAIVGEDSLTAALREVSEEIGIILDPKNGELYKRVKRSHKDSSHISDLWIFRQDVDINSVIYQPEEVCDAKLATKDDIKKMIEEGVFFEGFFSYIDDMFEMLSI